MQAYLSDLRGTTQLLTVRTSLVLNLAGGACEKDSGLWQVFRAPAEFLPMTSTLGPALCRGGLQRCPHLIGGLQPPSCRHGIPEARASVSAWLTAHPPHGALLSVTLVLPALSPGACKGPHSICDSSVVLASCLSPRAS